MAACKIVIVGGVAGGATAAARARRLSASAGIVVFERSPHVSFANCGLPYHIGEAIQRRDALLLQTPERLHRRYNLDIRVRTEVRSIDRERKQVLAVDLAAGREYAESYDKLLLATGAAPIRPPLPGIDHPRVFSLRNVPDTDAIKAAVDAGAGRAVIVGGGFIGLEMAENLRRRGLEVHLVEMLSQVMPPLDREMAEPIHDVLRRNGIRLHLGNRVQSLSDAGGHVTAVLESGASLAADLVILAIGVRPESELAEAAGLELGERGGIRVNARMQTSDPDIYAVGDAVLVTDVVTRAPALIPLAGGEHGRHGGVEAEFLDTVPDPLDRLVHAAIEVATAGSRAALWRAGQRDVQRAHDGDDLVIGDALGQLADERRDVLALHRRQLLEKEHVVAGPQH
ncbi:MAG: FAD/NAD(P)-binding oxidoreductase, partial [Phycisphaerae bacterium]